MSLRGVLPGGPARTLRGCFFLRRGYGGEGKGNRGMISVGVKATRITRSNVNSNADDNDNDDDANDNVDASTTTAARG